MVDRALHGVERELCGHPAREDGLVALEPREQMPAAVAELAQLLVGSSRPPTMLLGPINSLGRVGTRLPPAPRRQRPPLAAKQQLGLALQVCGESRVPFPIIRQGDREPRTLLVKRAGNLAPLRGDCLELALVQVAQLASRSVARDEELSAVVGADRVDQPLPQLPLVRQASLGHRSRRSGPRS